MKNILVVGAGFAGAVVAREMAEAGHRVLVIDARDHIAGNAYDYVNEHGIRVHKYGPHLWHTSNDEVQAWASRFTEWVPYEHWVRAQLPDGRTTRLPINNETIEDVFGHRFDDWCNTNGWSDEYDVKEGAHQAFLNSLLPTLDPEDDGDLNSREHVVNSVGEELCNLFFAPYTKKMWGLELEELAASVAARIPTSVGTRDRRYFPKDKHQYLPKDGYTAMFEKIFDHPNITVKLSTKRQELAQFTVIFPRMIPGWIDITFDHIFTSEPIDTYFNSDLGELPWRSVRMHHVSVPFPKALPSPVLNFTHNGPHTRVTEWKQLPAHGDNEHWTSLTFEEPCDYRDNNMERYYPVKVAGQVDPNRQLYFKYKARAEEVGINFIGRCGTYTYTDMAPCIASTLAQVRRVLASGVQ